MLTVADRVKETSTITGTGDFTLAGAVNGFAAFSSRLAVGDITFYCAILGTQWEVGLGTLTSSTTLARTAVFASSNSDALVSFVAGTKEVFVDAPAYLVDRLADFAIAEASVASAATVDLGAANSRKVAITGTAAVTSFGTRTHREKLLRFAGACTLTHNATSLILPTGANILTAPGDTALATSDASGNWRVRHYQRADGSPLAAGVGLDDFRALAIQVAKLKGSLANLFGGVVDDFKDASGIDAANSTNASLDTTANVVVNQSTDPYCTALLHFDGANGATSTSDVKGHAVTLGGGATLTTTQAKFGGSSLLLNGTSGYLSLGASADWALSTGDWTVEGWFYFNSTSSASYIIQFVNSGSDRSLIYMASGVLNLYSGAAGAVTIAGATTVTAGAWHHIALVKGGSTTSLYLDGVHQGSTTNTSYPAGTPTLSLSTDGAGGSFWSGYLDEFRISKGVARYFGNFTPPTSAFATGSSGAMDLRSIAFTAQAVPTKGSIFVLVKATADVIAANSNLTASLSRDGGTTWGTFTLAQTGSAAGFGIYEANGLDISGQPSGTSMKWRLQTVGTALGVSVDAVVAQWG